MCTTLLLTCFGNTLVSWMPPIGQSRQRNGQPEAHLSSALIQMHCFRSRHAWAALDFLTTSISNHCHKTKSGVSRNLRYQLRKSKQFSVKPQRHTSWRVTALQSLQSVNRVNQVDQPIRSIRLIRSSFSESHLAHLKLAQSQMRFIVRFPHTSYTMYIVRNCTLNCI